MCLPDGGGGGASNPNLSLYRGQSGCSLHKRGLEHVDSIRRGNDQSGIAHHMVHSHPGVPRDEAARSIVISTLACRQRNMERGLLEAIYIAEAEETPGIDPANRRGEWGRTTLRRVGVVERGNPEATGGYRSLDEVARGQRDTRQDVPNDPRRL